MTEDRRQRFITPAKAVIVIPKCGPIHKMDGRPMNRADFILVAQDILDRYESHFGNSDEIIHPSFLMDPKFLEMLNAAVKDGRRLTRCAIEKVFSGVSWKW